jgi:Uncharacterized conserved protein (DUF2190)
MPAPRDQGVSVNVTQSLSIQYLGAVKADAGTMVGFDGLIAGASVPVLGVLREDATQGRWVSVAVAGVVEAISGGTSLVSGNPISSDASGKGIPVTSGVHILGRVLPGVLSTTAGQKVQLLITREGTY